MERKGKELLRELLKDADDFATFKRIECPPIYLLGGSACILGGYLERATFDLDFIDIGYKASAGKVFRLFDRFDMLDPCVTPVAEGFEQRATLLDGFTTLRYYVLSREDIVVSKLGRYDEKDRQDIEHLMGACDRALVDKLICSVMARENFSERVKEAFARNVALFKEQHNV